MTGIPPISRGMLNDALAARISAAATALLWADALAAMDAVTALLPWPLVVRFRDAAEPLLRGLASVDPPRGYSDGDDYVDGGAVRDVLIETWESLT